MRKKFRPEPAWGSQAGLLKIAPQNSEPVPAQLFIDVQQVLNRFTWGTDERLLEVLADCFAEEAVWEASVMGETRVGPFVGRDQVLDWYTRFWPVQKDQRRHVLTNLIVDPVDADGNVEAHALMQVYGATRAKSDFEASAFCRFVLIHQSGRLVIRRLIAGFDSPFWSPHEVESMEDWLCDLFGIDPRDRPHGAETLGG
ncbi:nuclear transport factor 2 family protein [Leucobacter sp. Z1108]|uniref:nuclear transport factor 2 family protein n=1 Tax=Leucobacter sp. Z1108 TaxID=3439066 RepID=UPI003F317A37